ncbi:hypothetical protein [Helicobacter rappini]|uniref:hypothetical protein n=1 Tax=Helicobacter rappini TaxID=95150 RepID=UPI0013152023|nr:hypothetical protein [Helicobacter rappini]
MEDSKDFITHSAVLVDKRFHYYTLLYLLFDTIFLVILSDSEKSRFHCRYFATLSMTMGISMTRGRVGMTRIISMAGGGQGFCMTRWRFKGLHYIPPLLFPTQAR